MTNQTDPAALVKPLVKAALERAADPLHGMPFPELMSREYQQGVIDCTEHWIDAIRALADDPEVVAEIVEQVKGEGDG